MAKVDLNLVQYREQKTGSSGISFNFYSKEHQYLLYYTVYNITKLNFRF